MPLVTIIGNRAECVIFIPAIRDGILDEIRVVIFGEFLGHGASTFREPGGSRAVEDKSRETARSGGCAGY